MVCKNGKSMRLDSYTSESRKQELMSNEIGADGVCVWGGGGGDQRVNAKSETREGRFTPTSGFDGRDPDWGVHPSQSLLQPHLYHLVMH